MKNKNQHRVFRILQPNNKKAELTTQQIVLLIILIASFAIILFFLVRMNLGKTADSEICHNSVVMRGSSILPKDTVPLKCQRSYVCITQDGTCEELVKPEIKMVDTETDVYRVLAEEMADCWWMFGEGEIDYVGKKLFPGMYCSICDQVAFDDSLQEEIFVEGVIDRETFFKEYIEVTTVPGKDLTYSEYLYDVKNVDDLKSLLSEQDSDFGTMDLNKQYYIMMGVLSDVNTAGWVGIGAAVATATILGIHFAPAAIPIIGAVKVSSIKGILIFATGMGTGYYSGVLAEGDSGQKYLRSVLIEANSEKYEQLRCKSIETLA